MNDWQLQLEQCSEIFAKDINTLVTSAAIPLAEAVIPEEHGIDMFLFQGDIMYVGEAKGSGGLRDRILSKHLSGDESHALQKSFKIEFQNRMARREFIRQNIHVKWVVIDDTERVAMIERLAIWLFRPPWNCK